jgi:hypothetical protein
VTATARQPPRRVAPARCFYGSAYRECNQSPGPANPHGIFSRVTGHGNIGAAAFGIWYWDSFTGHRRPYRDCRLGNLHPRIKFCHTIFVTAIQEYCLRVHVLVHVAGMCAQHRRISPTTWMVERSGLKPLPHDCIYAYYSNWLDWGSLGATRTRCLLSEIAMVLHEWAVRRGELATQSAAGLCSKAISTPCTEPRGGADRR